VAKLVARLLATAALWVQIQTSLKNKKWATFAREWPTLSSPPKKYTKRIFSELLHLRHTSTKVNFSTKKNSYEQTQAKH
jgi:hypothetical protein